jgi:myo-inositol-1(or 4)-monophosphatase
MLENFWPVLGVFFMPVTGDIFYSRAGGPAFHGSTAISASIQDEITDESLLFTFSRFNHHYRTTFPGKIRTMGCAGAHICYVAMGRAEAAILANHSFSELAAASVILESAGGKLFTTEGEEFYLSNYLDGKRITEHLVAVPAATLSQVRACLTRI